MEGGNQGEKETRWEKGKRKRKGKTEKDKGDKKVKGGRKSSGTNRQEVIQRAGSRRVAVSNDSFSLDDS